MPRVPLPVSMTLLGEDATWAQGPAPAQELGRALARGLAPEPGPARGRAPARARERALARGPAQVREQGPAPERGQGPGRELGRARGSAPASAARHRSHGATTRRRWTSATGPGRLTSRPTTTGLRRFRGR